MNAIFLSAIKKLSENKLPITTLFFQSVTRLNSKSFKTREILRHFQLFSFVMFFQLRQFVISVSYKQVHTLRFTHLATASICRRNMKHTMRSLLKCPQFLAALQRRIENGTINASEHVHCSKKCRQIGMANLPGF